jgi:hypothetical protein
MDMDVQADTFRLRYIGSRFNGGRLPVDVLPDLQAFRDLLAAFAEDAWRHRNRSRKRLPKGFERSLAFSLTAIQDGSAIPVLQWDRNLAQAYFPGFPDSMEELVDRSFKDLVGLVDAAATGTLPASLPTGHVRALNKLGASLKDGERIEFLGSQGHDGDVVYLDSYRRKKLITHVKETYDKRVSGTGHLHANFQDGVIVVRTEAYGDLRLEVGSEAITSTYDGSLGQEVQFDVVLELDHNDRVRSIREIHDAVLVDDEEDLDWLRCALRLEELAELKPGWHGDGEGEAISTAARKAADTLLQLRPKFLQAYRIYPTLEGGLLIEFIASGWDLSVEFLPKGEVQIYGIETEGDGELEPVEFPSLNDDFLAEFDQRTDQ